MNFKNRYLQNAKKPKGIFGNHILNRMNKSHFDLSTWGRSFISDIKAENIIDIGCGGGMNIEQMLKLFPTSFITGVDYSITAVKKASKRNKKAIKDKKLIVEQGDVSNLKYQDNSFDLVTAIETVYFWPGPEKSFNEIYRILKPNGTFMITQEADGLNPNDEKLLDIIKDMNIFTKEEFYTMLSQVGLKNINIHHDIDKHWLCITCQK